ncbi:hypothetical protein JIN77_10245 [Verrucomicrobiaceae bacterium R5-34]|uniref:Uncharacterized protein n=1 Tax=Oceaniferula flava TaxID=2800421 RepID=A0AAE2SD13_9BACT|nr:hypothetical protein [Oceaniferula flavus]MBK1831107.1 hypothetical protein [Verrucomicrobiaceae bacterium R5-34]MBK1855623.1 hypothetical protein [Oceaniferula flavus]MBM1136929.1 hypothetical protein [Oceaniferula flavus]
MFYQLTLDQPLASSSSGRRHYRGRNQLSEESLVWNYDAHQVAADPPYWDDMISGSIRLGVQAAKMTFKPALIVWTLMAAISILYYTVPATHFIFAGLVTAQEIMGPLFPMIGMGLSVGFLVEFVSVMSSETRQWTRENSLNAVFNFALFGLMGLSTYYRYPLQNEWFGAGNTLGVLATKVAFDQFVWTVLLANPYQCFSYLWKNQGFSFEAVRKRIFPFRTFWGTQMLPVLIANWAFWIPMAFMVYSFPPELQLPLAILAITIWVMLLKVLAASTSKGES